MNIFRKLTMAAVAVSAVAAMSLPANAQNVASGSDAFSSGATGNMSQSANQDRTGAQSGQQAQNANAPSLQGATNGTIGPQGTDATFDRRQHRRYSTRKQLG